MAIYNISLSKNLNNLHKNFLTIRKKTNEILLKYDDVNYLDDPSVDIKAIAKENGIAVIPVPPQDINYEHAVLDDTDKDNIIIKVNQEDSEEGQLFSTAHEMEHFFKKKADMLEKADVFKNFDKVKKNSILKEADTFKNSDRLNDLAARSGGNYKEAVRILKKVKGTELVSKCVAETVTRNLGKKVSKDKAYVELAKQVIKNTGSIQKKNESFLLNVINKLYDEEIADYFAANILVPTERFILWKNKSNKVIAKKFKVPEACISKRREEIKNELKFITSKYSLHGNVIE